MDNSTPPFEVVCVNNQGVERFLKTKWKYNVVEILESGCYRLREIYINPTTGGIAGFFPSRFRRISPYGKSAISELCEQALKDTGDSRQDIKPERKEVESV